MAGGGVEFWNSLKPMHLNLALRFLCNQILSSPYWSCALRFCPPSNCLHSNPMSCPPFSTPTVNNDHSMKPCLSGPKINSRSLGPEISESLVYRVKTIANIYEAFHVSLQPVFHYIKPVNRQCIEYPVAWLRIRRFWKIWGGNALSQVTMDCNPFSGYSFNIHYVEFYITAWFPHAMPLNTFSFTEDVRLSVRKLCNSICSSCIYLLCM